jgi:riboflavin kinase / FMN adenylyltransferase
MELVQAQSLDTVRLDDDAGTSSVLTIGTFDGVHRGHQHLLSQLVWRARDCGRMSITLSFHPRPRNVLNPHSQVTYLSTPQERAKLMAPLGVDKLLVVPFTRTLAETPAEVFVRLLHDRLGMRELWVGSDFAMGRRREADVPRLQELGDAIGFTCRTVEPLRIDGHIVSSTRVRRLVSRGEVEEAARLLGRPYNVSARVAQGDHRGHSLGFPTANLHVAADRTMPADGVYVVWATVQGARRPGARYGGVANVGVRPSFGGDEKVLEVHILDFEGNLYDSDLVVHFVRFLRPERRFERVEDLVEQMTRDAAQARELLAAGGEPWTQKVQP